MAPFLRDPSVASSATLRSTPIGRTPAPTPSSAHATAGSEDVCMTDADSTAAGRANRRFIVAIDYGTTNSSASYAIPDNPLELRREQVQYITNYPKDPLTDLLPASIHQNSSNEVPSEVWYPDEDVQNADPFRYDIADARIVDTEADDDENYEHVNENEETADRAWERPKTYWRDVPDTVRWGFDAHPSATYSNASEFLNNRNSPIKWAKLQLADGKLRAGYPMKTRKSYNALKYHRVVRKELDFITDFLTCLFKHIKTELQNKHDLQDDEPVEMVLCVPVIWSCKARRDMHAAMAVAMKNSELGTTRSGCVEDLFIVSEPEAAAAYVLDEEYDIMVRDSPGCNVRVRTR